ncbi:MAG: TonB-dependent receptor [Ectothiorhodospiraceae bacterium]
MARRPVVSKGAALATAATLTAGVAGAQSQNTEAPAALDPIEVTSGVPAPGARQAQATAVDVLEGADKARRQGAGLGQTLEHLPGVSSVSTGNNVGKPVIRGLSGNRVRILSNGTGVDHQQYGTRHAPNMDPFLSDRIEVVRGVSGILYGSDALGGAIDVQSQPLGFSDDGTRRTDGEVITGFHGNNDQWNNGFKVDSRGEHWSFSAGVMRREADNTEVPDDRTAFNPETSTPFQSRESSDTPAYTGTLPFTDFEQTNGQLGVGYRDDFGAVRLRYQGWRNEHNFLLPPPAGNRPPGQGPEGIGQDLDNDEVQLSAELPVATEPDWTLKPSFTWQNNRRRSNAQGNPRSDLFDGNIDVEFDQYTARLEAEHGLIGPFDAGTVGVEVRRKEQVSRGTTQLAPGGEVDNLAAFVFEERSFGPLTLQAGLRHDRVETVGDAGETRAATRFDGRDRDSHSVTTGSLGGTFRLTDNLTVATNLGRGFRAPTLFERFADGVHGGVAAVQRGNPDLDPERSLEADMALRWQSPWLSASATAYRNQIDDFIFLADTGAENSGGLPIFEYRQGDATLTGVELEATAQVTETMEVSAVYEAVDGDNDDTGNDLPLQPADELRLDGTWRPAGHGWIRAPYVRLGLRYNASKQAAGNEPFAQFDGAPFGTASTDSYTVADLGAGFRFGAEASAPRVDVSVRNLTDESYRNFLDTYKGYALSPGRDVRLTLTVPFGG